MKRKKGPKNLDMSHPLRRFRVTVVTLTDGNVVTLIMGDSAEVILKAITTEGLLSKDDSSGIIFCIPPQQIRRILIQEEPEPLPAPHPGVEVLD